MRIAQVAFDLRLPVLAACELAIVPRSNEQRFAQKLQMFHQLVAQRAILMRVAAEDPKLVDVRHTWVRIAPLYTLLRKRLWRIDGHTARRGARNPAYYGVHGHVRSSLWAGTALARQSEEHVVQKRVHA